MDDAVPAVTRLTALDQEHLQQQRRLVEKYVPDDSREKFNTAAGKLGAIRALLAGKVFAATQTYQLQSLGVVLGDALAFYCGMEWVLVEDAYGRDPALSAPGTSILVYPLTMISKRVENGEAVDVFDLFNAVASDIERLRRQGR